MRSSGAKRSRELGVVLAEDRRQHPRGVAGGEHPGVGLAFLARELGDLGERDRDAGLRVDQQVVLGEEPGEQHPVPVLVGDLGDERVVASELTFLRTQRPTELAVGLGELVEGLVAVDGERGQRGTGCGLGGRSGLHDRAVQDLAEFAREGGHA